MLPPMASTATVSCSVWRVCFVVDVSPLILRGFLLRLRFLVRPAFAAASASLASLLQLLANANRLFTPSSLHLDHLSELAKTMVGSKHELAEHGHRCPWVTPCLRRFLSFFHLQSSLSSSLISGMGFALSSTTRRALACSRLVHNHTTEVSTTRRR